MDYRTPTQEMENAGIGAGIASDACPEPVQRNLLGRLHQRRRQLESELRKVNNSIDFVEKNQNLVELVEIVLASREKCDPRPY